MLNLNKVFAMLHFLRFFATLCAHESGYYSGLQMKIYYKSLLWTLGKPYIYIYFPFKKATISTRSSRCSWWGSTARPSTLCGLCSAKSTSSASSLFDNSKNLGKPLFILSFKSKHALPESRELF